MYFILNGKVLTLKAYSLFNIGSSEHDITDLLQVMDTNQ